MIPVQLKYLLAFLTALAGALYVLPHLASIARRIDLLDKPGEKRKMHKTPVPLVGGIGIVIAATFASMLFAGFSGLRGFFLGLAVLLLTGFLDDLHDLNSRRKFFAQIVATILMVYFSKVALLSFGDLLGGVGIGPLVLPDTPWIIWPVTVFCVVGVINAINLVDGLDGLAGGISCIAFLAFALLSFLEGNRVLTVVNLAFVGGIAGFLRYNWTPARIFMGDAGSLCLGFALAFMSLALTQGEGKGVSPVVPLLILALPITDTITVMGKRMLMRRNPFRADHYHLHHILLRCGFSKVGVVWRMLVGSFLFSGIAVVVYLFRIPEAYVFSGYCVWLAGYVVVSFFIVRLVRKSLRLKRKGWKTAGDVGRD